MTGPWQTSRQRDFTGGENQFKLPELVSRSQMMVMENVMIGPNGWLTDVFQSDIITISNALLGLALVPSAGGVYDAYGAPGTGILYKKSFDTSSAAVMDITTGTQTAIAQAYIKGLQPSVSFLAKDYCANPNPAANSNGILNLTDKVFIPITGKISTKLRRYTNRLWVINSDGSVQASDNGDATTWNPLNIFFLPNQDPVIDFIPVQGGAIVYGRSCVYAMYGASYQDITFVLLLDGQLFSSGAVDVDGVVYIPGARGMYQFSLNGGALIPHFQQDYFNQNYSIFAQSATSQSTLVAVHLTRFKSILVTWSTALGGTQGFLFNYVTKGYTKFNQLLPSDSPYMMEINDQNTDFLISMGAGYYAKSVYPSGVLNTYRIATMQTRHEDCNSTRNKVFRQLCVTTAEVVNGFSVSAYVDYSLTPIVIASNVILAAGENDFYLDLPRGRTISIMMTVDNQQMLEDGSGNLLTDGTNILTIGNTAATFTIKELKLKYREAGAPI